MVPQREAQLKKICAVRYHPPFRLYIKEKESIFLGIHSPKSFNS